MKYIALIGIPFVMALAVIGTMTIVPLHKHQLAWFISCVLIIAITFASIFNSIDWKGRSDSKIKKLN